MVELVVVYFMRVHYFFSYCGNCVRLLDGLWLQLIRLCGRWSKGPISYFANRVGATVLAGSGFCHRLCRSLYILCVDEYVSL